MNKKQKNIRSPFFYVGDKYKLMTQLQKIFPKNISTYIEPFVGGGSSFLNTDAKKYVLNDIDSEIINLHKLFLENSNDKEKLIKKIYQVIKKYNLSNSYLGIDVPDEVKNKNKKTYYSIYNKNAYIKLRNEFNKTKNNYILLYVLLIYGFNHMIRFNSKGEFNLPVGNVDFNKNVYNAILDYLTFTEDKNITLYNVDFENFLNMVDYEENSYVYLDPPYLISSSEYNKYWSEKDEIRLYKCLDILNEKGIKFGITNLIEHKGKKNSILLEWSKKYNVYFIKSNYISFNDNTIKSNSKEIFVTNYGKK